MKEIDELYKKAISCWKVMTYAFVGDAIHPSLFFSIGYLIGSWGFFIAAGAKEMLNELEKDSIHVRRKNDSNSQQN